jgi:hypothetical protein
MEKIIIIMLIITLGIFIYMYFTLRSQIKDITTQLDFIEKNRSNALGESRRSKSTCSCT